MQTMHSWLRYIIFLLAITASGTAAALFTSDTIYLAENNYLTCAISGSRINCQYHTPTVDASSTISSTGFFIIRGIRFQPGPGAPYLCVRGGGASGDKIFCWTIYYNTSTQTLINSSDPRDRRNEDSDSPPFDVGDLLLNQWDNCDYVINIDQLDTDHDSAGNACDTDDDNDGVTDSNDAFPLNSAETLDTDHDGIGNNADTDDDGDGVPDYIDADPLNAAINTEKNLTLDNSYHGSSVTENTGKQ